MAVGRKTGGRQKGTPNKTTGLLKDAILKAAELAGGEPGKNTPGGIVAYLTQQAKANPTAFMSLLGRVLPMQLSGDGGGPVQTQQIAPAESPRDTFMRRINALAARNAERSNDERSIHERLN